VGKRNQEHRRARKKQREAQQRPRSTGDHQAGFGGGGPFGGPQPALPEIVDTMLVGLLKAPEGAAEAVRSSHAPMVVARGPAGVHVLSRALLSLAAIIVKSCWRTGWQPADLVRLTGRRLTARHARLVVDMIAAESRQYAPASLEPRWSAQLREVAATVWWEDDRSYLHARGEREGLDVLGMLTAAVEVLRVIGWLPELPPVGPPPGSQPSARPGTARVEDEPRVLHKIRALLAKAESTEYTEEADALTEKAQQLMAHHSISAALLSAGAGGKDSPATRRIGIDNPYEAPKALLLDAVGAANRCRAVWSGHFGFSTLVGYEPDLDAVELLYTSLLVQATAAMNRAGSRQDRYGRSRTRSFRQSFLVAYATRIRQRLSAATEQATSDAVAGVTPQEMDSGARAGAGNPALLPVLAAREDAVSAATEQLFPGVKGQVVGGNDQEGWAHGTAAADRATLHGYTEVASPR
jgi:hypothetical protein